MLPVTWTYFTSVCNGQSTILRWGTANESQNNRFEVERSTDNKNWIVTGSVDGAGTSNSGRQYEFSEKSSDGIVYYRLKQVDEDGTHSYSKIIPVSCGNSGSLRVFPNPVRDILYLNGAEIGSTYRVINGQQQVVRSGTLSASTAQVSLVGLPAGNYYLQVTGKSEVKSVQFMKAGR